MPKQTQAVAKKKSHWNALLWAKGSFDIPFLILTIALLTIGLIMLFSASYSYAYYNDGDSLYYFKRQIGFAVLGVAAMFVVSKLNYGVFKIFAYPGLAVSFALLVLVLLLPPTFDDFHRWIDLGFTTFQPSEIAKVALVIYCAYQMDKEHQKLRQKTWAFLPYMIIIALMAGLIFLENHVSGCILVFVLGVVMLFIGGVKMRWFVIGFILVAIVGVAVYMFPEKLLPEHASVRIIAWKDKTYSPQNHRWQTNQSLYAIGSGGFLGTGLGQSKQKHLYVSEPQNDFIFAIVCEELGFVGAAIIILLYVLLVWRGFTIAMRARDRFSAFLVMGLVIQIGLQVALNIAVVTDTMPNTGISLPFFSYGGTSLCILLAEIGMVLSVSRSSNLNKT